MYTTQCHTFWCRWIQGLLSGRVYLCLVQINRIQVMRDVQRMKLVYICPFHVKPLLEAT